MPYRELIFVSDGQLREHFVRILRRATGARPWTEVEPEAEKAWTSISWRTTQPWESVREEVRSAWEREPIGTP